MKHVWIANVNHFDSHRISELLVQHKIDFFFKDSHESSLQSGWMVPGSSSNERMLYVDELKETESQEIIKKYMNDYSD